MAFQPTVYKRNQDIINARKQGMTYSSIGKIHGVSKQRIEQILNIKKRRSEWFITNQKLRTTCFICRKRLTERRKFCDSCVKVNKLNEGGKELPRGMIRGRDANTCQVCGYEWRGTEKKRLDVHHLDGLCGKLSRKYDGPEMMYKLITVCHKCHYNLHDHATYGRGKVTH